MGGCGFVLPPICGAEIVSVAEIASETRELYPEVNDPVYVIRTGVAGEVAAVVRRLEALPCQSAALWGILRRNEW